MNLTLSATLLPNLRGSSLCVALATDSRRARSPISDFPKDEPLSIIARCEGCFSTERENKDSRFARVLYFGIQNARVLTDPSFDPRNVNVSGSGYLPSHSSF